METVVDAFDGDVDPSVPAMDFLFSNSSLSPKSRQELLLSSVLIGTGTSVGGGILRVRTVVLADPRVGGLAFCRARIH